MSIPIIILCGGRGTRLKEETEFRPKPLVKIGQHPILWHIMKIYAHYGFKDFVLCLGYKGEMIKEYFLNYEAMNNDFSIQLGQHHEIVFHSKHLESDWNITLADTGETTRTGGRIKKIEKYINNELFMLTYGDGVSNVDITKLLEFHKSHGKVATVTGVHPSSRFGELTTEDKKVQKFNEKPQTKEGFINGGFFVFDKRFFDYLEENDNCYLERGPLESLARKGELMVFEHKGFWQCIDTYRELERLNNIWDKGNAPWKTW